MYFYICFQYFTKIGCCGLLSRESATATVLTTDGRSGSLAGLSIAGFGMGEPPAIAAGAHGVNLEPKTGCSATIRSPGEEEIVDAGQPGPAALSEAAGRQREES